MGFFDAISTCWSKWADFQGRARRSEYWFWQLFVWLVFIAFFVMDGIISVSGGRTAGNVFLLIGVALFAISMFLPGLAVLVRRMHDLGVTGWIVLISLIPYLGGLILLIMSIVPGTEGDNAYGPDSRKKAMSAEEHF